MNNIESADYIIRVAHEDKKQLHAWYYKNINDYNAIILFKCFCGV